MAELLFYLNNKFGKNRARGFTFYVWCFGALGVICIVLSIIFFADNYPIFSAGVAMLWIGLVILAITIYLLRYARFLNDVGIYITNVLVWSYEHNAKIGINDMLLRIMNRFVCIRYVNFFHDFLMGTISISFKQYSRLLIKINKNSSPTVNKQLPFTLRALMMELIYSYNRTALDFDFFAEEKDISIDQANSTLTKKIIKRSWFTGSWLDIGFLRGFCKTNPSYDIKNFISLDGQQIRWLKQCYRNALSQQDDKIATYRYAINKLWWWCGFIALFSVVVFAITTTFLFKFQLNQSGPALSILFVFNIIGVLALVIIFCQAMHNFYLLKKLILIKCNFSKKTTGIDFGQWCFDKTMAYTSPVVFHDFEKAIMTTGDFVFSLKDCEQIIDEIRKVNPLLAKNCFPGFDVLLALNDY